MKKVKKRKKRLFQCILSIYCLVTISILLNTCIFVFIFRLVGMNLLGSILFMFENDYVSGDCFSISLDSFVRQPEMDVLHSWPVILPQFSGKSSLKE